ncbi:WXG100 family type VII secretion target [Amycolatopsis sp. NPDC059657]|uniref:WXG100 family type VII secretion target n=1 Tax=Amycolatopsis sp. NPDC059657 TaxID=3346899 RepID=UPI003672EB70
MSDQTTLTPADVSAMAKRHTSTAESISNQQKTLDGNIQTLTSINKGAMMTKLTSVHTDWNTNTTKIVDTLREMATTLDSVAQRLQSQDEESSSGL